MVNEISIVLSNRARLFFLIIIFIVKVLMMKVFLVYWKLHLLVSKVIVSVYLLSPHLINF